jgi:hypothetical protein
MKKITLEIVMTEECWRTCGSGETLDKEVKDLNSEAGVLKASYKVEHLDNGDAE